jgi:flagellar FliJ protein
MNFHFSLEKVLKVKENEKNTLETEYRQAYQNYEKIAGALYEFLKQKEELEKRRLEGMTKGAVIGDVRRLQAEMEHLQQKIDEYERLYRHARQHAELKKEHLLERSVDVKRYEKLRDFQYSEFVKKAKAKEMSKLDEMSTMRHSMQ